MRRMSGSPRRLLGALALLMSLAPTAATGQTLDGPYTAAGGRLVFGGEVAAVAGKADSIAFFNYTDYAHNALRMARVRLIGEWRLADRLSLLGEVRTENGDGAEVAALYARWRPSVRRDFDIQIGRIPPVAGAFTRRAYGRDNPVIGTPLAYQYLTSLRPDALPLTMDDLLRMRARGWQPSYPLGSHTEAPGVALVSSFRWDTGVEARYGYGRVELAGAYTLGAPAVPVVRETNDGRELSARVAVRATGGLTIGVSGAKGQWIDRAVLSQLAEPLRGHSTQWLAGVDAEFKWLRWIIRGEALRSVFEIPVAFAAAPEVNLPAWSGFLEARYRLSPRWQFAARVEQLDFGEIQGTAGGAPTPWDAPVKRVEAVAGYRVLRNLELRAGWQQNWRPFGRVHDKGFPALQALYWF